MEGTPLAHSSVQCDQGAVLPLHGARLLSACVRSLVTVCNIVCLVKYFDELFYTTPQPPPRSSAPTFSRLLSCPSDFGRVAACLESCQRLHPPVSSQPAYFLFSILALLFCLSEIDSSVIRDLSQPDDDICLCCPVLYLLPLDPLEPLSFDSQPCFSFRRLVPSLCGHCQSTYPHCMARPCQRRCSFHAPVHDIA